jgi:hypothetical protein
MFKRSFDVIATDLGDELILLDPRNGEMFALNASGRRIWLELPAPSPAPLADALCSTFRVERDRALADVEAHLASLIGAALVVSDDTID